MRFVTFLHIFDNCSNKKNIYALLSTVKNILLSNNKTENESAATDIFQNRQRLLLILLNF